jgi:hypothetical protein
MSGDHGLQLGVGKPGDIDNADPMILRRLAPATSGLKPEDRSGDGLCPVGRRLAEQELSDLGGRLDLTCVEFIAIVLAERLRIDADTRAMSASGTP